MARGSSLIFAQAAELWNEMKRDYDAHLEHEFFAAEEATSGFMVNRAGKTAGVTALDLFRGPEHLAYRYASHELITHWRHNPRPSIARFEAQWLDARPVWTGENGYT